MSNRRDVFTSAFLSFDFSESSIGGQRIYFALFRLGNLHLAYALDGVGKHLGILVQNF